MNSIKRNITGAAVLLALIIGQGCSKDPQAAFVRNNPLDPGGTVCDFCTLLGGSDVETFAAMDALSDGGCIIAGSTMSFGNGGGDAWLVRLNSAGATRWAKTYGGAATEQARCVRAAADGGFFLLAQVDASGDTHTMASIIRTDAAGEVLWQRAHGDSMVLFPHWLAVTADQGCVIVGYGATVSGGVYGVYGGRLIKYNATGDTLWNVFLGSADARCVEATPDGGLIVVTDDELVKLTGAGAITWRHPFGLSTLRIVAAADGGYLCNSSVSLVKIDASGDVVWNKNVGDYGMNYLQSVRRDPKGGYLLAGYNSWDDGDACFCGIGEDGMRRTALTLPGLGRAGEAARSAAGGCLIAGQCQRTGSKTDLFVYKTKADIY